MTSISIHHVVSVVVKPADDRKNDRTKKKYQVQDIVITDKDGKQTIITLFSETDKFED